MGRARISRQVEDVFWQQWCSGLRLEDAAVAAGVSRSTARGWVHQRGGVKPKKSSSGPALSLDDRISIEAGIKAGLSNAAIAREIDRPNCTIGREIERNMHPSAVGPANQRRSYSAAKAQERAEDKRRRPKVRKLDVNPVLREQVQQMLDDDLSPEQVAGRLRRMFGDDPDMTISYEVIYQGVYVQGIDGLQRPLTARLRTGRTVRKPRRRPAERRGRIKNMVGIAERPPEAAGRQVPGHWEGDLILGKENKSAVGTLVDRCSRTTRLLHLPDGYHPAQLRDVLTDTLGGWPESLKLTITWDQGFEMHRHEQITAATGVPIFFCDAHSPWQRPSNENTNGLARQYLPKGTDLSVHTRDDLNRIENLLNNRPRKTLDWMTPNEYLEQVVENSTIALTT